MPKGYIIITEDVKDPAAFAEYGKLAAKATEGSTLLSFDPNPEVLEGDWHGPQTVVLEFESEDAAKEWYYGDAYQEAAKLRQAAADMIGSVGLEAFDLDLDRQQIGIGLGEDARRHQAALGEQRKRARQHARLGVGFETVSDGG